MKHVQHPFLPLVEDGIPLHKIKVLTLPQLLPKLAIDGKEMFNERYCSHWH
jgi:hypothetical protein